MRLVARLLAALMLVTLLWACSTPSDDNGGTAEEIEHEITRSCSSTTLEDSLGE